MGNSSREQTEAGESQRTQGHSSDLQRSQSLIGLPVSVRREIFEAPRRRKSKSFRGTTVASRRQIFEPGDQNRGQSPKLLNEPRKSVDKARKVRQDKFKPTKTALMEGNSNNRTTEKDFKSGNLFRSLLTTRRVRFKSPVEQEKHSATFQNPPAAPISGSSTTLYTSERAKQSGPRRGQLKNTEGRTGANYQAAKGINDSRKNRVDEPEVIKISNQGTSGNLKLTPGRKESSNSKKDLVGTSNPWALKTPRSRSVRGELVRLRRELFEPSNPALVRTQSAESLPEMSKSQDRESVRTLRYKFEDPKSTKAFSKTSPNKSPGERLDAWTFPRRQRKSSKKEMVVMSRTLKELNISRDEDCIQPATSQQKNTHSTKSEWRKSQVSESREVPSRRGKGTQENGVPSIVVTNEDSTPGLAEEQDHQNYYSHPAKEPIYDNVHDDISDAGSDNFFVDDFSSGDDDFHDEHDDEDDTYERIGTYSNC